MPVIEHINVNGITYDIGGSNSNYYILGWTDNEISGAQDGESYLTFSRYGDPSFSYTEYSQYGQISLSDMERFSEDVNNGVPVYYCNFDNDICLLTRPDYFSYDSGYYFRAVFTDRPGGVWTVQISVGYTPDGDGDTFYFGRSEKFCDDTKVTQSSTTTSSNFPILIKSTTTSGSTTNVVYHSNKVLMNPSVGVIAITTPTASNTSTSAGGYRIYNGAANNANITGALFNAANGTASVVGITKLQLGNSTASGTANNASGQIAMYANTAFSATIMPITTLAGNRTFILPQTNDSANKMLVASVTSGTGSGVTPTYVNANGQVVACSYPLLPYREVTSW